MSRMCSITIALSRRDEGWRQEANTTIQLSIEDAHRLETEQLTVEYAHHAGKYWTEYRLPGIGKDGLYRMFDAVGLADRLAGLPEGEWDDVSIGVNWYPRTAAEIREELENRK